jgi:hypothetical protein
MANTQQTLNFPVAYAFNVELKSLHHIVAIDTFTHLFNSKIIQTAAAFVSLFTFDDTIFRDVFGVTFGARRKNTGHLYFFSKYISF